MLCGCRGTETSSQRVCKVGKDNEEEDIAGIKVKVSDEKVNFAVSRHIFYWCMKREEHSGSEAVEQGQDGAASG